MDANAKDRRFIRRVAGELLAVSKLATRGLWYPLGSEVRAAESGTPRTEGESRHYDDEPLIAESIMRPGDAVYLAALSPDRVSEFARLSLRISKDHGELSQLVIDLIPQLSAAAGALERHTPGLAQDIRERAERISALVNYEEIPF